jgi:hypothetical protein
LRRGRDRVRVHGGATMITKQKAIKIWNRGAFPGRDQTYGMAWNDGGLALLEALDRAGAFPSEETAAEIADVAREILDRAEQAPKPWTGMLQRKALRLASACRAVGLVKP